MTKCAIPICNRNTAKYLMGWLDKNGRKQSGLVCSIHDKLLGRQNLMKYAGMTLQEAKDWEKENKEDMKDEGSRL